MLLYKDLAKDTRGRKNSHSGFSLVELLVVVAILAILAAIAIPMFLNQKTKANQAALTNDIHILVTEWKTNGRTPNTALPNARADHDGDFAGDPLSEELKKWITIPYLRSKVPGAYIALTPNRGFNNGSTTAVDSPGDMIIWSGATGMGGSVVGYDTRSGKYFKQIDTDDPTGQRWNTSEGASGYVWIPGT